MTKGVVTSEQVDAIFEKSPKEYWYAFNQCFVVAVRLPNGRVVTGEAIGNSDEGDEAEMYLLRDIAMTSVKRKIHQIEVHGDRFNLKPVNTKSNGRYRR